MLEKSLTGSKTYLAWMALLLIIAGTGVFFYLRQLDYGLGITGMSRDVS
jgi:molybdopterin-containing oxidoreductase family membrane subunit